MHDSSFSCIDASTEGRNRYLDHLDYNSNTNLHEVYLVQHNESGWNWGRGESKTCGDGTLCVPVSKLTLDHLFSVDTFRRMGTR